MSDPASNEEAGNPAERRDHVRHRRRLDIVWQLTGPSAGTSVSGRVVDVSRSGLGLTVDQPFAGDSVLTVRLPSKSRGWTSHLVRVRHCRPAGAGQYKLGCSFVKPLTDEELRALLG